jgi:hypothetical protein
MATANLDISEKLDIVCKRGDSFSMSITMTNSSGTAIDTSNYVFKLMVKSKDINGGRAAGINLPVSYDSTILTIDNVNGSASGVATFNETASTMASIDPGVYVYDIQYTDETEVKTILEGLFKVNPDVTF